MRCQEVTGRLRGGKGSLSLSLSLSHTHIFSLSLPFPLSLPLTHTFTPVNAIIRKPQEPPTVPGGHRDPGTGRMKAMSTARDSDDRDAEPRLGRQERTRPHREQ